MALLHDVWPAVSQVEGIKKYVAAMAAVEEDAVSVAAAPYRICPLGAHIDHQGGPVTATAINLGVLLGFVPSGRPQVWLRSRQCRGDVRFSIHDVPVRGRGAKRKSPAPPPPRGSESEAAANGGAGAKSGGEEGEEGSWGDFARGAVLALQTKGYSLKQGITGVVDGMAGLQGGGISSSAALGVALLLALEHANGLSVSREENIELDRAIENGYLGLRNGVLDQAAILLSRRGCLTRINCQDRTHGVVPPPWVPRMPRPPGGLDPQNASPSADGGYPPPYRILLAFSGLQHALALNPGYNQRVEECRAAAQTLLGAAGRGDHEPILANVSLEEYALHKHRLTREEAKRAEHFFSECARVEAGVGAWQDGDLHTFGFLMSQSGESSIVNYECGCEPLIQLREILLATPGVLGARFSGAGFRGCCVALVERTAAEAATAAVQRAYAEAQPELAQNLAGREAVLLCDSADGALVLEGTVIGQAPRP